MARDGYRGVAFDATGRIERNARVYVRRRNSTGAAPIYPDVDATEPMLNPFPVDPFGRFRFHATGGIYDVTIFTGTLEAMKTIDEYPVGIGTAQWVDAEQVGEPGYRYEFLAGTEPPTDLGRMTANHADPGEATALYVHKLTLNSVDVGTRLLELTSVGKSSPNILNLNGFGIGGSFRVLSTSDDGDYVTLNVDPSAYTGATSLAGNAVALQTIITGPDGAFSGLLFNWSTTVGGTPAASTIRASHASLADATALLVSKETTFGQSLGARLLGIGNVANTLKARLSLSRPGVGTQATFDVTGVTDDAGFVSIAVANHAGATSFPDEALVAFYDAPAGPMGALDGVESYWHAVLTGTANAGQKGQSANAAGVLSYVDDQVLDPAERERVLTALGASTVGKALIASVDGQAARVASGTDYMPGSININTLSGGVLQIPEDGEHFVLTWPGNANFTISGFGNLRPPGKAFDLLVPRTASLTGGSANALGNWVRFTHAASGAGLDLTMAMRMIAGSPVYTYDAYPNANGPNIGSGVRAAALFEQLRFVPLGGGRHRLVRLPEPAFGRNSGPWQRYPNGWQEVALHTVPLAFSAATTLSATVPLPLAFASADAYSAFVMPAPTQGGAIDSVSANTAPNLTQLDGRYGGQTATSIVAGMTRITGGNNFVSANVGRVDILAKGWWK